MKIVGTTDQGYLAQVTEDEIALITGCGRYPRYGRDGEPEVFSKITGRTRISERIPTNTEITIIPMFDYIELIRSRARTAKKAAADLRELADALDNPIPATIAPREPDQKK